MSIVITFQQVGGITRNGILRISRNSIGNFMIYGEFEKEENRIIKGCV